MKLETLDRFVPALDEVAERCDAATFYHSGVWIESLAEVLPELQFRCLVLGDGRPQAYLPYFLAESRFGHSCWSLPFGTYGGPVAGPEGGATEQLLKAFLGLRHQPHVSEVGLVDYRNEVALSDLDVEQVSTHVLDLRPGFDAIWGAFDKSKRRQARKAEREGIEVREAESVDEVVAYYRIYEQRSEQWHQRVRYPEALFVNLFERGRGRSVRLFLSRLGNRIIGGHLNFYYKDTVIAWNGVTDQHSRAHQASTALYAACIRHACEGGFHRYNLGGSVGRESLVAYKESLGGVLYSYRLLRWRSLRRKMAAAIRRRIAGR